MRAITTHQYLWETVPLLFLLDFPFLSFSFQRLLRPTDHPLPVFFLE